jgi:hypothetical protein
MEPSNENVLKGIEAIASSAMAGGAPVRVEMESRDQAFAVFGDYPMLSNVVDATRVPNGPGTVTFQSHSPVAWRVVVKVKPQEPAATTYRDRMIAAAGDMHLLLEQAVRRVELARKDGDKILSAWLPEAKRILAKIDREDEEGIDAPGNVDMVIMSDAEYQQFIKGVKRTHAATEQEDPERFDTSTM